MLTLTRARPYERSRVTEMNGNCQLQYQKSKSRDNFEFLPLMRAMRAHNARADTYGRGNSEML